MRKIKSIALLALLMSSSLFISCSNDSDNEDTAEASTGDYWPTAVNNQWVMDQNGTESTMKIVSSEKVNDDTYFKFNQFSLAQDGGEGSATAAIKKVKGDYYIKIADVIYNANGITGKTTGYEFIFFKDYLEVNKTWTGSYTQETSFDFPGVPVIKLNVNYTGTILEKGATATVNSVSYKDVIKFKFLMETKMEGQTASSVTVEYWVAKDVGIIKMTSGSTVSELVSYSLK